MFTKQNSDENHYQIIHSTLEILLEDAPSVIAKLANMSALLQVYLDDINWVGFYLYENNQLQLGPFQGLPACSTIPLDKGVCGYAARTKKTIIVEDVHQFPGHIACDGASESEIVIPIIIDGELYGVLDIDAPIKNRFDKEDQVRLEHCVHLLIEALKKP